jgi:hypothetical protein
MALKELKIPDSATIANPDETDSILGFYNSIGDFAKRTKALLDGTIVDSRDWEMRFVEDGTYSLALNTPFGMTISEVTTDCDSGTCTATVKINGTSLGGTANSVSTTEQTRTHTTANVAAIGDEVTLVISANSSCENMRLSFKFTRPLIV